MSYYDAAESSKLPVPPEKRGLRKTGKKKSMIAVAGHTFYVVCSLVDCHDVTVFSLVVHCSEDVQK